MRKQPWTRRPQRDWAQLPCAEVDWLVVWNVNLGAGGDDAFSTRYAGRDLPFKPREVAPEAAWVWVANGEAVPSGWRDHRQGTGGIFGHIGLLTSGVPIQAGDVVVLPDGLASPIERLTTTFTATVGQRGHAWCPALVGNRSGPRPAVSVQGSDGSTAIRLAAPIGADELLIVDPFAERDIASSSDALILVTGTPEGTRRRARSGMDGLANVTLPEWLATRRYPTPWWLT